MIIKTDIPDKVFIRTESEEEQKKLVESILDQLEGNEDFDNGNITLFTNSENEVKLCVSEECENIPSITIK